MIKYSDWELYLKGQTYPDGNGSIYLWGGQGQTLDNLTDAYIDKRETSANNAKRVKALRDKRVMQGYKSLRAYDCSGLGVFMLLGAGEISSDMTANGMYNKVKKISRSELRPGDFVFRLYTSGASKGNAHHVGYVVSDLKIVHAKGRDVGVVEETLNQNGNDWWNGYGRSEWVEPKPEGYKAYIFKQNLSKKKCSGKYMEDVKALQWWLNKEGFNAGSEDGFFGKKTDKAVKACQRKHRLTRDGIAGKNTIKALGAIWGGK